MAVMQAELEFTFLEPMPENLMLKRYHNQPVFVRDNYIEESELVCPYHLRSTLKTRGSSRNGIPTEAGLSCPTCNYFFDILSGWEYEVQ